MTAAPNAARDAILGTLRRATAGRDETAARREVEERLATRPRNLIPARARLTGEAALAQFVVQATASAATVERVPGRGAVPTAVAAYLAAANLPARARVAPEIADLPWGDAPVLEIGAGPARPDDLVSITGALAGVAETGTLLTHSSFGHPTTLNFLPSVHIVVLEASRIVGAYEDAWDLLRRRLTAAGRPMPRTVNLITGPSRTADIEQTPQLHAHGPGRLHIILVGSPDGHFEVGSPDGHVVVGSPESDFVVGSPDAVA